MTSRFDQFLTKEEQARIPVAVRRMIDAFNMPQSMRNVFEEMTEEQQVFVGVLARLVDEYAVAAHAEVDALKSRGIS